MMFNSFQYVVFLPLVVMAYYLLPHRFRWIMLLGVSYYFYMCWRVEFALLMLASSFIDYWAGINMAAKKDKKDRRPYLVASMVFNLGILFFFKYFNFLTYNVELALGEFNFFYDSPFLDILLPVGISFYTFQSLSYTFDVYKGKCDAEQHLGYFLLYVCYFPQLVAGPIERPGSLIPQITRDTRATADDVRYGINKILLGFFKKVVVADSIAVFVDQMYGHIPNGSGLMYYFTMILFLLQIFSDFSGYTDIALGSARLMGVRLMENFDRPLYVTNLQDSWNRWHISLTTWIRDYIFIPLALKNKGRRELYTILVFVVIGLWHGASWNFMIFGLFHGINVVLQRYYRDIKALQPLGKNFLVRQVYSLWNFHLIAFGCIFFRTQNLHDAWRVITHIFTDFRLGKAEVQSPYQTEFMMAILVSVLLYFTVFFNKELRFRWNWLYITVILLVIVLLGQDVKNQFIYFQF
jgi:alginate O-acetyltransferase complex protein AlgI